MSTMAEYNPCLSKSNVKVRRINALSECPKLLE